jgi:hypothetical protein
MVRRFTLAPGCASSCRPSRVTIDATRIAAEKNLIFERGADALGNPDRRLVVLPIRLIGGAPK